MMKKNRRLYAALAIFAFLIITTLLLFPSPEWEKLHNVTGHQMSAQGISGVGSTGGEWRVIALAQSDMLTPADASAYLSKVETYVEKLPSDQIHPRKSSDNSRVILGVSAAGGNPASIGGKNLLNGLADMNYITKQGITGPIWALIALDCTDYNIPISGIPENQVTRDRLIAYITTRQEPDGGWGLAKGSSDIDVTAMAIQALAKYSNREEISQIIDKAISYMSAQQNEEGLYVSFGTDSSESCAQVIVALTSVGIDPDQDDRFIKNGQSVLDALCSYHAEDGFLHTQKDEQANPTATEQAFYALTAYRRFKDGKPPLYQFQ